jgi:hypothetical protein
MLGYLYGKRFGSKNRLSQLSPSFWLAQASFRDKNFPVYYPTFPTPVTLHTYSPMKMEQTGCSETLAFKLQTSVNHPEESYKVQNIAKFEIKKCEIN